MNSTKTAFSLLKICLPVIGVFYMRVLSGELDLTGVIDRIESKNPDIRAALSRVESMKHGAAQKGVLLNPELEVGTENLGMSEFEVIVSQPLRLGGKRGASVKTAELMLFRTEKELEALRVKMKAEAVKRCVELMEIKSRLNILDTAVSLAGSDHENIVRRVRAGAARDIDSIRSLAALEEVLAQKEMAGSRLRGAREELAALWGDTSGQDFRFTGSLAGNIPAVDKDRAVEGLKAHPLIEINNIEYELNREMLASEKAGACPDMTLSGGYLRNNEAEENAGIIGVSVGLPLFNRNREAIESQEKSVEAAGYNREAKWTDARSKTSSLVYEMNALRDKIETFEESIIPRLSKVHESLRDYYGRGLVGILDVLQSRKDLIQKELESAGLRAEWLRKSADLLEVSGAEHEIQH